AIPLLAFVNGEPSDVARPVSDRDVIEVRPCANVAEMRRADPDGPWDMPGHFRSVVNGQPVRLTPPAGAGIKLMLSGQPGDDRTPITPGVSVVSILAAPSGWPTLDEVLPCVQDVVRPLTAG